MREGYSKSAESHRKITNNESKAAYRHCRHETTIWIAPHTHKNVIIVRQKISFPDEGKRKRYVCNMDSCHGQLMGNGVTSNSKPLSTL